MATSNSQLPLEIATVTTKNLLWTLESVRNYLKTTSILWMHALSLPVLNGIVVADWSKSSATAVQKFFRINGFSSALLRIDKRYDRWTHRRGGYLIALREISQVMRQLKSEGMIAMLLEPASPYDDRYSIAGVTLPDEAKMVLEVVGPGFDTSDILRSDLQPHERWEVSLDETNPSDRHMVVPTAKRIHLVTPEQYTESVQRRLAKIGARTINPAFPDVELNAPPLDSARLIKSGTAFLERTRQTVLLKNASAFVPIPLRHITSFTCHVQKLLSGLSAYGIHLGPSSFAASVIPKRGLIFWDFFPARKQEAARLYPPT